MAKGVASVGDGAGDRINGDVHHIQYHSYIHISYHINNLSAANQQVPYQSEYGHR